MMKGTHGVKKVGDHCSARGDGSTGLFVCGFRMAD